MKYFIKNEVVACMALMAGALASQPAHAFLRGGYLKIPGVQGQSKNPQFKNWVRVEAHYWKSLDGRLPDPRVRKAVERRLFYSGPAAPQKGGDQLSISLLKKDPASAALMAVCQKSKRLAELTFAESADVTRPSPEVGERPSEVVPPSWTVWRLS